MSATTMKPRSMTTVSTLMSAALAVAVLAFAPVAAHARVVHFASDLDTAKEVPPHTTDGAGTLKASYDTVSKAFDYEITYQNLTGPAVAAHFHGPALAGHNAPPVLPIAPDALASPIHGHVVLTGDQAKDLLAGKWYFNVHTKTNPGGEIRAQVLKAD